MSEAIDTSGDTHPMALSSDELDSIRKIRDMRILRDEARNLADDCKELLEMVVEEYAVDPVFEDEIRAVLERFRWKAWYE